MTHNTLYMSNLFYGKYADNLQLFLDLKEELHRMKQNEIICMTRENVRF